MSFIIPISTQIPTTTVIEQNTSFTGIRSSSSNQSAISLSVRCETDQEHGDTPSKVSQVSNTLVNLFEGIKLTYNFSNDLM